MFRDAKLSLPAFTSGRSRCTILVHENVAGPRDGNGCGRSCSQLSGIGPREWIDPDTGHRVVRLSDEPGSQSLYLHQYAYTPDGKSLLITTPTGVSAIDLKTRSVAKVVDGRVSLLMTGRKTGRAYYVKDGTVYTTDPGTKRVVRSPGSLLTAQS